MSEQRSRLLSMIGAFWMVVLICSALSGTALATDDQDQDDATLVGAWRTRVVFPGTSFEFFSYEVFNEEGTMTNRVSAVGPGTSVGIGTCKKLPGCAYFSNTSEGYNDSNSDGFLDRRFRVRLTIQHLAHNRFKGTRTLDNLSLDGTTLLGPRFQALPFRPRGCV